MSKQEIIQSVPDLFGGLNRFLQKHGKFDLCVE